MAMPCLMAVHEEINRKINAKIDNKLIFFFTDNDQVLKCQLENIPDRHMERFVHPVPQQFGAAFKPPSMRVSVIVGAFNNRNQELCATLSTFFMLHLHPLEDLYFSWSILPLQVELYSFCLPFP